MSETQSQQESDESKPARGRADHGKDSGAKRDVEAEKQAERETEDERKRAEKQAEWDAYDIEAFLAAHRGERLLRGSDGSFDHDLHQDARRSERERKFEDEG